MSDSLTDGQWRVEDSAKGGWNMPPAVGDLPDINVWLALAVQEHPHHARARAYWGDGTGAGGENVARTRWFCRTTMLGLVRLLCQPKVVGAGALQLREAYALYQSLVATPGVAMLNEPFEAETHLTALLSAGPLPPRLWTDAWLAAIARSSGLRMVTFDRDFERFALPACLVLAT